MDSQELRNLQEAYMEVVENQQLDEAEGSYGQTPKADAAYTKLATTKGKSSKTKSLALKHAVRSAADSYNSDKPYSHRIKMTQSDRDYHRGQSENRGGDRGGIAYHRFDTGASGPGGKPKGKKLERQKKTGVSAESYDYYDIILSHLLDEGYADTNKAALTIMANMSEEWRQSIVEEMLDEELQGKAREKGEELLKKTKGKPNSFQKNSRINWLLGKSKKHPSHEYGTVSRSAEEKGQSRAPKQTKARKGQTKKQGVKTLGGGGGNVGSYGMPQKDTLPRGKGNKAARRAGTYRED